MNRVSQFPISDNSVQTVQISEQKIQRETILEYLKVFGFIKTLSEAEQKQFIQTALAGNLDPFKREIHLAVYGEGEKRKLSILTGYQVYLKRAERTGNLDGWRAWFEGEGHQMKAVVEIFRKDWTHSFTHEVYWEEAVQKKKDGSPTQFWAKQPHFQLRKVAIAQGFRLAFPDELGSLPYESAELSDSSAGNDMKGSLPDGENLAEGTLNVRVHGNHVEAVNSDSNNSLTDEALDDSWPFGDAAEQEPLKPAPAADMKSNKHEGSNENDLRKKAIQLLESLFESHPKDFAIKHQAWILDKVYKATDKAGIEKMLAYAEKVLKKSA